MHKTLLTAALLASAAALTSPVSAQTVAVRLCTGAETGNYYQAGRYIAARAKGRLDVEVIPTAGSLDNLDRLASGVQRNNSRRAVTRRCRSARFTANSTAARSHTAAHHATVQGATKPETDAISAARVRGSREVMPIFTMPGRVPLPDQAG